MQTETDPHRLAQRQKQLDYGFRMKEFKAYAAAHNKPLIPVPDIYKGRSKRSFDGLIREWKSRLYIWYRTKKLDELFSSPEYKDYSGPPLISYSDVNREDFDEFYEAAENAIYADYLFIPDQCIECHFPANYVEESNPKNFFCGVECQMKRALRKAS